jgi:hypothetical protein
MAASTSFRLAITTERASRCRRPPSLDGVYAVAFPSDVDPFQRGAERLVETARPVEDIPGERGLPFRDLADGAYWHYPIACLTAHMALVLIRAGWAEHPMTRSALNACRHRFESGRGFGCNVMNDSLLPACVMTVPKVLKALLALPRELRTREDEAWRPPDGHDASTG